MSDVSLVELIPLIHCLRRSQCRNSCDSGWQVDCDKYRPICDEFEVRAYPSVKWFSADGEDIDT